MSWQNSKFVAQNPTISFRNVTISASGNYTCALRNQASQNFSLSTMLKVEKIIAPYIVKTGLPAPTGLELDCNIDGSPPPKYQWFKDGTAYGTGRLLKFSEEDNSGTYQCLATNRAGSATNSFEVKTAGRSYGIFLLLGALALGVLGIFVWKISAKLGWKKNR